MRNEHEAEAIANSLETRNGCPSGFGLGPVCDKAAALIRRQRARIEELEAALRRLRDSTRGLSTEWDVGSDVWSSLENATYLLNRKD